MNVNRVVVTGNLTKDPEMVGSSGNICKLRLAVNTRRKNRDGEWVDSPNYFDVTVFGKQGENCAQYLSRGRPVAIDGRLEWREWETDGQKRQAVGIVAESVQFLGDGRGGGGGNGSSSVESDIPADTSEFDAPVAAGAADDDIPFLREETPTELDVWHGHANR